MDSSTWDAVDRLVGWLDGESRLSAGDERLLRILKLSEEVGEVGQAVIGATGQNPRKGVTHSWEDVQHEICDVVLAALVALRTLTPEAREVFAERMAHVEARSLAARSPVPGLDVPPTGRLDLLPLRVEHAEEMAEVLGDPRLHTFIGGEPYGPQALRARYQRMTAGSPEPGELWLNWVLRLREESRLVGAVQATVSGSTAELAWVIGTPWQGRGYATEAARALLDRLVGQPFAPAVPLTAVVAHIHPDHHASAAVATALGLRPAGRRDDGELRWQLDLAQVR
ncbi:GNAT family N-acetyltransferase [Kitasatospora sp. NPDC001175]|uniref:GNAT family N-acetyltransferase n=1 Tax=Kitasatospora sp. NPDC001175 TaxID=3157103 RepID=UPI003D019105